jgi:diadenosine tetraphosphatase ApaH/serine/threonine PP2A family protein phosphatase
MPGDAVRYLILSDVHGNLDALDAVLANAENAWDRAIVLGDLAGYGAEPNEVLDRVRALDPIAIIRGNHDKAACGLDDGTQFNQVARAAAVWTFDHLTPSNREYLCELPRGPLVVDDLVEICHGAPFDEDHYIFDGLDAHRAIAMLTRPICFFGHTHLPVIFRLDEHDFSGVVPDGDPETRVPLAKDAKYLVNPGSVGQPRDGDPRAAYGVMDAASRIVRLRRVAYPVESAQRKILAAGLPATLANRLAVGR